MKRSNLIFVGWQGVISVIAVVAAVLLEPAHCQTADITLLLQKSPFQGGTITPSEGIYHFTLNSEITLTAVPKPGYHFVCWLGDVIDPTSSSTVTYLDEPKIIIAVFAGSQGATVGGGTVGTDLIVSAPDYSRRGWGGPGAKKPKPPPIPEPATLLLLGLGGMMLRRRC